MTVATVAQCRDCHQDVEVQGGRFVAHGECPGWFALSDDEEGWKHGLESRFTPARADCPHPERWHSRDADSTESEVTDLVAAFVRALRPDVVVETGSAWGQTAEAIGRVLEEAGVGVLHTLEPNPERAFFTRERVDGLPVLVHDVGSGEWDPVDGIDFAWLDSLHHLRVPEFRRFRPHMSSRAIVGFHDTGPHQGGLRDEILQLEHESQLLPIFLPTPRGVCFAEVL
jgi:Methyltransferase domain